MDISLTLKRTCEQKRDLHSARSSTTRTYPIPASELPITDPMLFSPVYHCIAVSRVATASVRSGIKTVDVVAKVDTRCVEIARQGKHTASRTGCTSRTLIPEPPFY